MTVNGDLELARRAAKAAGAIIAAGLRSPGSIIHKGAVDLVTATDLAAEKVACDLLAEARPQDGILGEEGGERPSLSGRRWILDPLDGTTNFAHGLPHCCVSLALEDRLGLKLGVVYQPFTHELFWAVRGEGAWLGEQRLQVSSRAMPGEALVASGFPYDRRDRAEEYLVYVRAVLVQCQGFRRNGAAALDLAWLAAGRFDAFWEFGLKPWDVAAGLLLIREAGGRTTSVTGEPAGLGDASLVATNGPLHSWLLGTLEAASRP